MIRKVSFMAFNQQVHNLLRGIAQESIEDWKVPPSIFSDEIVEIFFPVNDRYRSMSCFVEHAKM